MVTRVITRAKILYGSGSLFYTPFLSMGTYCVLSVYFKLTPTESRTSQFYNPREQVLFNHISPKNDPDENNSILISAVFRTYSLF